MIKRQKKNRVAHTRKYGETHSVRYCLKEEREKNDTSSNG